MVEMWGYCLVGYFTGRFPGLKAIYELKSKWGVICQIKRHDKGWVIFKFQTEADRLKVLKEGPYVIFGKLLMLKVLSEDFTFDDEEFLKVPIWVKFPRLPMKLWNKEAMSEVASMVGVPLTTDMVTQERSNHNFARVLIEVDASKPPMLSFPIRLPSRKVINQSVVYETFPNFCFHCKKYGHNPFSCIEIYEKEEMEKKLLEKEVKKTNEISVVESETKDTAPNEFEAGGEVSVPEDIPPAEIVKEHTQEALTEAAQASQDATAAPVPVVVPVVTPNMESSDEYSDEVPDEVEEEDLDQLDSNEVVEVYRDGKIFKIRKNAKVDRRGMIRRIPGLSWEETLARFKIAPK
ncbi:unnamed protein product [Cuscuta europaea]|uniref:DUF4283 domain-containing protein n=1 Tax=Cuscuta europaea TaxID=41803 RepID=A0A9P0Z005_CUSEU|nr:unnamed protein product [Cuscuta europaea]